jgi:hypothetical protein
MITNLSRLRWPRCIFGINLFFVFATAMFPYVHDSAFKWNVVNHFNLAAEMNLGAWWSSSLLLLCAIIAYQLSAQYSELRGAWLVLALIFTVLSFDEFGSVHERASNTSSGTLALLVAGILFGIGTIWSGSRLWRHKQDRRALIELIVGMALLASAAPNEWLEHRLNWPYYAQGVRVATEEGLEITGMLISLHGLTRYRLTPSSRPSLAEIGLDTGLAVRLKEVMVFVFLLHLGTAWIVDRYISLDYRGNPAVWYVMAALLIVALAHGWKSITGPPSGSIAGMVLFGYFLTLSAGSAYFVLPRSNSKLHDLWLLSDPNILLECQVVVLVLLYVFAWKRISVTTILVFVTMALVLALSWFLAHQSMVYAVSGLFALTVAWLFLPEPASSYSVYPVMRQNGPEIN